MRSVLWCAAATAVLFLSPAVARGTLATSAAALLEATPFLLAGAALQRAVGSAAVGPYFGCGCEPGPSARSLPAALATCLAFGPLVAAARVAAATLVARRIGRVGGGCPHRAAGTLVSLAALLPAAATAAVANLALSSVDPARLPGPLQLAGGAVLGFFGAGCALGTVAVAAALHARAPLASWAFLCISGIVDVRALPRRHDADRGHDGFAYALLAFAAIATGVRHGGGLVHPAMSLALECGGVAMAVAAWRYRRSRNGRLRMAPLLMTVGLVVAAPPPVYRATETTMSDLFAGERLSFTGQLSQAGNEAALVRYAITCCRADAAPVVVQLARAPSYSTGTWLRADGVIEIFAGRARLRAARLSRAAPPDDPFVYR